MIKIKEGVSYDDKKSYEEQTEDFKNYVNELFSLKPKVPYPGFNKDGSITYFAQDAFLKYEMTRYQQFPFSKTNRAVKELKYVIKIK